MNIQVGLFVCGLLAVIVEGRHFLQNKHLCDLHVQISQVSVPTKFI